MRLLKNGLLLAIVLIFVLILSVLLLADDATATPTANPMPACALMMTATPTASLTLTPTITPSPAPTQTPDVTVEPLSAIQIEPFDVHFNPKREKAFAVVMNFTLSLQNNLPQDLKAKNPAFELTLGGVEWGELVSTDFRMGVIQARGTYGIVLQTLLLMKNATDAQKAVLDCIKAGAPVDVRVHGTIITMPGSTEMPLDIDLTAEGLVLPTSN